MQVMWIFTALALDLSADYTNRSLRGPDQEKKLKNFCKKFAEAIQEFAETEERKIKQQKIVIPSDEVINICLINYSQTLFNDSLYQSKWDILKLDCLCHFKN